MNTLQRTINCAVPRVLIVAVQGGYAYRSGDYQWGEPRTLPEAAEFARSAGWEVEAVDFPANTSPALRHQIESILQNTNPSHL